MVKSFSLAASKKSRGSYFAWNNSNRITATESVRNSDGTLLLLLLLAVATCFYILKFIYYVKIPEPSH